MGGGCSSRRRLFGTFEDGSGELNGELAGLLGGTEGWLEDGATQVVLFGGWLGGAASGTSDAPGF
jgi:hypothetical protein